MFDFLQNYGQKLIFVFILQTFAYFQTFGLIILKPVYLYILNI